MDGERSSYNGIGVVGRVSEAYPGVNLGDFNENTRDLEEKKTVAIGDVHEQLDQKQTVLVKDGIVSHPKDLTPELSVQGASHRLRRAKLWMILGIVAVVMIIVIVVPVGVIVPRKKSASASPPAISSDAPLAPIAVPPGKPAGVLNGTRLSTMDSRTRGDTYLFYQHGDGGLRYIPQSPQGIWQGSINLEVIDAIPGTPLASISTSTNGSVFWWLFYVDNFSVIQNIYSKSDPATWRRGSVGKNGYRVPNQTNIAFTASRGREFNTSSNDLGGGLSLYAGGIDGNIHEYIFDDQDGSWSDGFIFPNTDVFGGATTYSTAKNAYFFALGRHQTIDTWWRNYDPSPSNNDNTWHLGPSSHDSIIGNASMCAQNLIAFQGSNGMIQGSNFTGSDNPAAKRWGVESNISNQPAISGSALSCWYSPSRRNESEGLMFQVFYQVEGNRIDEARKRWGPGNATLSVDWTYVVVLT